MALFSRYRGIQEILPTKESLLEWRILRAFEEHFHDHNLCTSTAAVSPAVAIGLFCASPCLVR
jgi:hypothetical protein